MGSLEKYAFTWSPKGTTYDPDIKNNEIIYDIFRRWRHAMEFMITPELNKNGNIHYHGIIAIRDKIAWYKRLLPELKRKGFVLIKSIDDYDKWFAYIKKDYEVKKAVFTQYEITQDTIPKRTKAKPCPDLEYGCPILSALQVGASKAQSKQ